MIDWSLAALFLCLGVLIGVALGLAIAHVVLKKAPQPVKTAAP